MFYALNENGQRITADEANKEEKYICPICNNHVVLKKGLINISHFAHEHNVCKDTWNYDMSEWHKRMQNYFPKECQEVVVNYQGQIHRADVLIDDIVLEFQNSPITAAEFEDRNEFFKKAGYRLAWIFNLSRVYDDTLYASESEEYMMIWKHPMRIFENVDYIGDNNKRFAIWFSFRGDDELEEFGEEYLDKVIWAIKDEYGQYSMRRFFTSEYSITMSDNKPINPNHFFYSKKDYFNNALNELKRKHSFSVKYKGKKGEPKQSYMCPRKNGTFGIDMWGDKGCQHCRYCYMIAQTHNKYENSSASYCCYPNQVRELFETHPGWECPQVEVFEI